MAEQEQQHIQGQVNIAPDPEKIRRIAREKKEHTGDNTTPHHPDVEQEKNSARASNDADQVDARRIINPKNNSSNQYR